VLIETANALAGCGHQVEIVTHEYRAAAPFYPLAPGRRLIPLRAIDASRWRMPFDSARRLLESAPETAGLDDAWCV
jgi:hypothetical protein